MVSLCLFTLHSEQEMRRLGLDKLWKKSLQTGKLCWPKLVSDMCNLVILRRIHPVTMNTFHMTHDNRRFCKENPQIAAGRVLFPPCSLLYRFPTCRYTALMHKSFKNHDFPLLKIKVIQSIEPLRNTTTLFPPHIVAYVDQTEFSQDANFCRSLKYKVINWCQAHKINLAGAQWLKFVLKESWRHLRVSPWALSRIHSMPCIYNPGSGYYLMFPSSWPFWYLCLCSL